jgi:hypothetical protein
MSNETRHSFSRCMATTVASAFLSLGAISFEVVAEDGPVQLTAQAPLILAQEEGTSPGTAGMQRREGRRETRRGGESTEGSGETTEGSGETSESSGEATEPAGESTGSTTESQ